VRQEFAAAAAVFAEATTLVTQSVGGSKMTEVTVALGAIVGAWWASGGDAASVIGVLNVQNKWTPSVAEQELYAWLQGQGHIRMTQQSLVEWYTQLSSGKQSDALLSHVQSWLHCNLQVAHPLAETNHILHQKTTLPVAWPSDLAWWSRTLGRYLLVPALPGDSGALPGAVLWKGGKRYAPLALARKYIRWECTPGSWDTLCRTMLLEGCKQRQWNPINVPSMPSPQILVVGDFQDTISFEGIVSEIGTELCSFVHLMKCLSAVEAIGVSDQSPAVNTMRPSDADVSAVSHDTLDADASSVSRWVVRERTSTGLAVWKAPPRAFLQAEAQLLFSRSPATNTAVASAAMITRNISPDFVGTPQYWTTPTCSGGSRQRCARAVAEVRVNPIARALAAVATANSLHSMPSRIIATTSVSSTGVGVGTTTTTSVHAIDQRDGTISADLQPGDVQVQTANTKHSTRRKQTVKKSNAGLNAVWSVRVLRSDVVSATELVEYWIKRRITTVIAAGTGAQRICDSALSLLSKHPQRHAIRVCRAPRIHCQKPTVLKRKHSTDTMDIAIVAGSEKSKRLKSNTVE
jgi:hypothetical protein